MVRKVLWPAAKAIIAYVFTMFRRPDVQMSREFSPSHAYSTDFDFDEICGGTDKMITFWTKLY